MRFTCSAIRLDKSLSQPRPIYDSKFKCPVDRLDRLCCDAASGLDTVHGSSTEQACTLTPRLLHALAVEESLRMLPHLLLTSSIHHCLVCVWRKPPQYTPKQASVYDHVNLKTLVQTRLGDMNGDGSRSVMWYLVSQQGPSLITK